MSSWDIHWMTVADLMAQRSKDSSKFGAVAVDDMNRLLSCGYNGLPRGLENYDDQLSSPDKYMYWVHAEQNVVFNAASLGVSLQFASLYTQQVPCCECAKAIIQSGIKRLVYRDETSPYDAEVHGETNWRLTIPATWDMLKRGGVKIERISIRRV